MPSIKSYLLIIIPYACLLTFAENNYSYAIDLNHSEKEKIYYNELYGTYEPTTNADWAIFGYIKVDKENVSWGRKKELLSCSAEYKITSIEKIRGSKTLKGSYDNILFTYYTLNVFNKKCDYSQMLNPHISKWLGQWEIAIPSNGVNSAALIRDCREDGTGGGTASAWIKMPSIE